MSTTIVPSSKKIGEYHHIGPYKYSEKQQIGEGFSSKVYKGINTSNQLPVAIKVINSDILSQEIHVTLLQSELKILEIMKGCENVLEMHEIIRKDIQNYIITEICTTDLSKIIQPLLPIDKIENYLQQLLTGFQQLFRREIIHRDLKPANLLIDSSGNLKIGDFGFAIKITQVRNQIKFNIGSPLYMAPEALKKNQYSYKSDIWSIGIILYEMLTGDTPWRADNQQQLYEKLEKVRIDHLLVNKKFPEHLKQFLRKSLQFDRKYRISPQQIIKMKISSRSDSQKTASSFQKQQSMTSIRTQKNLFIPRVQKNSKTQKFYKAQMDSNPNLCKTSASIKQQHVPISIKSANKNIQSQDTHSKTVTQKKEGNYLSIKNQKQTTHSSAKTQGSTTLQANQQNQIPQILTKQESKNITNNLVYYIHICRLLYKIIVRLDECIENNFNVRVIEQLTNIRDNLLRRYCNVIVKYMYKVKNFSHFNFIQVQSNLYEEYVITNQFKKLKKVCAEYIQRYSKSQQLKYLWVLREQPDFKTCLEITRQVIRLLWPELCQKNHNQIILLEFILFAHEAFMSLEKGSHQFIKNKNRIENYVDTIPNPPSVNRFKLAIAGGKKVSMEYPPIIKQQREE